MATQPSTDKPRRLLRTTEEILQAGRDACKARGDKLSPERYRLLADMVRPYLRLDEPAA